MNAMYNEIVANAGDWYAEQYQMDTDGRIGIEIHAEDSTVIDRFPLKDEDACKRWFKSQRECERCAAPTWC